MEHFVLGIVFNSTRKEVLLIEKKQPKWMTGRWNGIGGHIEPGETPFEAMVRETDEETKCDFPWRHQITFVCPGGTVFVYTAVDVNEQIQFTQVEDEPLYQWPLVTLPFLIMNNMRWMIPLCLADVTTPVMVTQKTLGTD